MTQKLPPPEKRKPRHWRAMAAARKTCGGGRPRLQNAPRCPCAVMTLARAITRGKSTEHNPGCAYYRA